MATVVGLELMSPAWESRINALDQVLATRRSFNVFQLISFNFWGKNGEILETGTYLG